VGEGDLADDHLVIVLLHDVLGPLLEIGPPAATIALWG